MKFSDILKSKGKGDQPQEPDPNAGSSSASPSSESFALKDLPAPQAEEPDHVIEQRVAAHALKATEVYTEGMAAVRNVYRAVEQSQTNQLPKEILFKILALLQSGNEELLALADRSSPDNYLYGHVLNVTIFSMRLGMTMNLSKDELYLLSLNAFLQDLGMIPYMSLALKPTRLSEPEMTEIRKHPLKSRESLALFPGLTGDMREQVHQIVGQIHERVAGNGYPERCQADAIHRFAKIIGVCDVYEAITHVRSWRQRALPHDALRLMIDKHEQEFEPGIVKTLIEALSLYPPGSFVRLNSGEMGRVIFTNSGLPTRPKVKLLIDAHGDRFTEPKIINLAVQPILYVAEAVDETRIQCTDQKLILELRAQRWWVKGI